MTQTYSRRTFLNLVGATAGTMALAACAPAGAPAPGGEAAAGADSDAAIEIQFWTHTYAPLVNYIEQKMGEYKDVAGNVTIVHTATETSQYDERLFTAMAAGTGPDGFNNGEGNFAVLMNNDWLAPVAPEVFDLTTNDEVQDLFFDYSLTGIVGADGDLRAIPLEWNALHLFFHRGAFAEAGLDPDNPPATWEEITEAAAALTKTDDVGNITFPGFQQSYGPGTEWPLKRLHPMLVQAGLDVLNSALDSCTMDNAETIEVIEYYTDWTTKLKVSVEGFSVPGVQGNPFRSGYVGMDLSGSYNPGAIKTASPDWAFDAPDGWGIGNFPQWGGGRTKQPAAGMWRWGAFVNKDSAHAVDTWAFVRFLIDNSSEYNAATGYIPSLKGWLDDPANHEAAPWLATMQKDLEIGVPIPQTVKYQQLARQILEMLERVYDGSQTVTESVGQACEGINTIMQEA